MKKNKIIYAIFFSCQIIILFIQVMFSKSFFSNMSGFEKIISYGLGNIISWLMVIVANLLAILSARRMFRTKGIERKIAVIAFLFLYIFCGYMIFETTSKKSKTNVKENQILSFKIANLKNEIKDLKVSKNLKEQRYKMYLKSTSKALDEKRSIYFKKSTFSKMESDIANISKIIEKKSKEMTELKAKVSEKTSIIIFIIFAIALQFAELFVQISLFFLEKEDIKIEIPKQELKKAPASDKVQNIIEPKKIKEFREKMKWTQEEIAEKINISKTTYNKIENNRTKIKQGALLSKIKDFQKKHQVNFFSEA